MKSRKHWEEGRLNRTIVASRRPRYEKYVELVQKFSHESDSGGFRLELGCGGGRLATLIPHYIGLSISFRELTEIRRTVNETALLICADAQKIPFKEQTVAMIFEHGFLEHVPDPNEVLSQITKIIQPGGIIIHDTAWNVRPWAVSPTTYKSYWECGIGEKLFKIAIPLRNNLAFRFARIFPKRLLNEFRQLIRPKPVLNYKKLVPNYDLKVGSDVDACSSIDPHALILFYKSNGFETLQFYKRLFFRTGPVVIRVLDVAQMKIGLNP